MINFLDLIFEELQIMPYMCVRYKLANRYKQQQIISEQELAQIFSECNAKPNKVMDYLIGDGVIQEQGGYLVFAGGNKK